MELIFLRNGALEAAFHPLGARLVSLRYDGTDVALGFDSIEEFLEKIPYAGATCGRVSNRIEGGKFSLSGKSYQLPCNWKTHHLHGGPKGWSHRQWTAESSASEAFVKFTLSSPDGDEGYPYAVETSVVYTIAGDELIVEMTAIPSGPTPINMVHHTYWNLDGHGSGSVEDHVLTLGCDFYTPFNNTENLIPTGEILSVVGTPLDFKEEACLRDRLSKIENDFGLDHNFVVSSSPDATGMALVAKIRGPKTGITMELSSNMPGLQIYTTNTFPAEGMTGKRNAAYHRRQGICLETQFFPNSVNARHFPSIIFDRSHPYFHKMIHKFSK